MEGERKGRVEGRRGDSNPPHMSGYVADERLKLSLFL